MKPWRKFGPEAYGTRSTGYLLVGEAPGYGSWKNGRRFTGPAGLLIRRALRQVGDPRYQDLEDLVYMTDVVKCHPAPRTNPTTNRAPLRAEIEACGDFLVKELELLRPTVILCFGKVAAERVQRAVHAAGKHVAGAVEGIRGDVSGAGPGSRAAWARPEVLAFPHPSPRNQLTVRKRYPSMTAFEAALTATFRGLIAGLHRTGSDA